MLAVVSVAVASAQTIGTPIFKGPYRSFKTSELAGYISDPGEGVSIALEGEYRLATAELRLRPPVRLIWTASGNLDNSLRGRRGRPGDRWPGTPRSSRSTHRSPPGSVRCSPMATLGFYIPLGVSLGRQVLLEGVQGQLHPVRRTR